MASQRTVVALFLAVLLVGLVGLFGPLKLNVRGLTWSAGTSVTPPLAIDGKPYVIQDWENTLWLAYESSRSGNFDIYIRTFTAGSWNAEQQRTTSMAYDLSPSLVQLSNGDILLAWSSDASGTYATWTQTYGGGSWASSSQLTFPPANARDANPTLMRLTNGTVWLFWSRETLSGQTVLRHLYYRTYNNGAWSGDQQFSTGGSEQQPNLLQLDDGTIWVTYAANRLGNLDLYYRKLTGASWSAETPMTANVNEDRQSWLMQDNNGLLYLFWTRCVPYSGQNCQDDIFYKTSSNRGSTWSAEVVFTVDPQGETIADSHPTGILAKDKKIYVFWGTNLMGLGTDFDVYLSISDQVQGHDVGVAGIVATPDAVRPGGTISIIVTVTNYGDYPETVQVTVTAANTTSIPLGTQPASLPAEASMNLTYTWNTTAAPFGKYTVTARIPPIYGESVVSQADNVLSVYGTRVVLPPDVNLDGAVDIVDAAILASVFGTNMGPEDIDRNCHVDIVDAATLAFAFGSTPGSQAWDPRADLDGNARIDIVDAALLAARYGSVVGPEDIDGDCDVDIVDAALLAFWFGTGS